MTYYSIPLVVPHLAGNEKKYINECLDSKQISHDGTFIKDFEDEFAAYTGANFAISVSNGTAALHLALLAAGVKPGEGVFAPVVTFIAPINAISYVRARPVFVDVDSDSMGISPESVQSFIDKFCYFKDGTLINRFSNEKITALVAVHTYGHSPRIDELSEITQKYNLALIEDASVAVGTRYKDKHVGTFGQFGCFSFTGNKLLATGNGGMITTNDEKLADKIKHLKNHAITDSYYFYHDEVGYNYKMTNIAAALGLAQMEYITQTISSKRKVHFLYEQAFKELEHIELLTELDWCRSNYWMAILKVADSKKDDFVSFMKDNSIESRPLWELNNRHPMYSACSCANIDNSIALYDSIVAIPCHQSMTDTQIQFVIDKVTEFDRTAFPAEQDDSETVNENEKIEVVGA